MVPGLVDCDHIMGWLAQAFDIMRKMANARADAGVDNGPRGRASMALAAAGGDQRAADISGIEGVEEFQYVIGAGRDAAGNMGEIIFLGHQEKLPKLRRDGADLPTMGGPAPAAKATEIRVIGRFNAIGAAIDRIDFRLVGDLGQYFLQKCRWRH